MSIVELYGMILPTGHEPSLIVISSIAMKALSSMPTIASNETWNKMNSNAKVPVNKWPTFSYFLELNTSLDKI